MYQYVLFDLDGTLTDPKEGICKSVQYALHEMKIDEPDLDKLECFIGPPLRNSFRDFYHLSDEQCELGIKKYRERYASIGIFENELYPGMKELLKTLHDRGVHMAVASSKPKLFVERILKHFEIEQYFEVVAGSDMSEKKVEKIDIMREALSLLFHVPEEKILRNKDKRIIPIDQILMVGDRKFDIEGAKHFFLDSIGVSYGYAAEGELKEAGATYITDNLDDVYEIILGEKPALQTGTSNTFKKSFHVLMPLVYNFALTYAVLFILQILLDTALNGAFRSYAGWFSTHSSRVAVYFDAFATLVCAIVFLVLYQKEKKKPISLVVKRRRDKRLLRDVAWIAGLGVTLALFLNLLFSYFQIMTSSQAYKEVAGVQYSVAIGWGLLIYGLIKPVGEELIFRGLIYGRMRLYYPVMFCIPISALIFGAYHGNFVQLLYGFIMGCLLAWMFEKYRSLKANILFHSAANIAVYLVSVIPALNQAMFHVASVVGCGVLAAVLGLVLIKKDKAAGFKTQTSSSDS
ncbi:MAG: HAD hydrolase-like protein [Lachnospiraceae bacterium]|nr:HAD hydrolase-like protein [Lachnospiraceae bacterium]